MAELAHRISPGTFVTATLDGAAVLCLKVEREARDYVNHYLVPVEPCADPASLALVYIDPEDGFETVEGVRLAVGEPRSGEAGIGEVVAAGEGRYLKVLDDPRSQKLFCFVDLATGLVRPRPKRGETAVAGWTVVRS
ncbi:MAG: hypothetical protein ACM31L_15195 [Actinomycetota bacterium]